MGLGCGCPAARSLGWPRSPLLHWQVRTPRWSQHVGHAGHQRGGHRGSGLGIGLRSVEDICGRPGGAAPATDCHQPAHGVPVGRWDSQLGPLTLSPHSPTHSLHHSLHLTLFISSSSPRLRPLDASTTWDHAAIVHGLRVSRYTKPYFPAQCSTVEMCLCVITHKCYIWSRR